MITATGIKNGKELEVVVTGKRNLLFDGEANQPYEDEFMEEVNKTHHVGMYYPPKDSVLNYLNVLENHFFDYNVAAKTNEAVEEIPYEEGVVY